MNIWPVMVIGGLLTFLTRLSFIILFEKMQTPPLLQRALRFIPPAVLSAIILPELLIRSDRLDFSPGNFRLVAGVLAGLVAWRTRNALLTIVTGMGALLLLQAIF